MSDLEYDYDSDQEVSEHHSKLLDAVRQLDKGQRVKKPERTEPSLEVSEFHLVKSGITDQDAVAIEDLAKTLGQKGHHDALSKKISATKARTQVLPKPLEKPTAEKIKRQVGFENTKKELGKWAGIVARNRTAASVSFPLKNGSSIKMEPSDEYVKRFRIKSELEKKLDALKPPEEPEEEKDEFPLTLAEILEKRQEAAKFRAQQSYKAAKAIRQNKIKSKKFHRIQRKEKIKKALKEFEELQKTDPQAALEKLEEIERARAEERMTLRHKSTGQWAQSKQIRAKYDKESRQVLAEQLAISRELTQKLKKDDDSDEDENDEALPVHLMNVDKDNPWMNPMKSESEVDQFLSSYRKFWDEKNKSELKQNGEDENGLSIKKVFEEPEITEVSKVSKVSKKLNPVEEVVEYMPSQNGSLEEVINLDHLEKGSLKQEKKLKLQKSSVNKSSVKSAKSKVITSKKSNVKAGTSEWSVSVVESPAVNSKKNPKDIDELFDSVEENIQQKIKTKLAKVKRILKEESKPEKKRVKKQKREDDVTKDLEKLGLKNQKGVRPVIDKPMEESASSHPSSEVLPSSNYVDLNRMDLSNKKLASSREIDPNKFINLKPKQMKTLLPDEVGGEEDALDDSETEENQHQIISEAFADDDVVDEFRKEKEAEIKKSQPEDIDLTLPGWGSWGGKDIKPSSRKRKRFLMKFPKEAPRRDENKGDVVIIEEKCPKIKRHLVSELPFPFTSVQDYEASIRVPIGREFVPEKSFGKLITPAVKTKMGKIIEPMSEEVLVKKTDGLKKRKKPKESEKDKEAKGKRNLKEVRGTKRAGKNSAVA